MTEINNNLWLALAKTYMQGITLPSPGQEGYLAYVNADGTNFAYAPPVQDLPPITGALRVLQTNSGGTAVEWTTAPTVTGLTCSGTVGGAILTASSYVAAGTGTVATYGAIRLPNNGDIVGKGSDGADLPLIGTAAENNSVYIGGNTAYDIVFTMTNVARWSRWDGAVGTELLRLQSDRLRPGPNNTLHLGDGTHYWLDSYITTMYGTTVALGTSPSTTGAVRLAAGQGVYGVNNSGSNLRMIATQSGGNDLYVGDQNTEDVVTTLTQAAVWSQWVDPAYTELLRLQGDRLRPGLHNTMLLGDSTHYWSIGYVTTMYGTTVALGTNAASTGNLRLASLGTAKARNAANSGNVDVLSTDSSDRVVLGGSGCAGVVTTNPQIASSTRIATWTAGVAIDSGVIPYVAEHMAVDTEGAAANDFLDTINGGVDGAILRIKSVNAARNVILTKSGNITWGGATTTAMLGDSVDVITLVYKESLSKWLISAYGPGVVFA